MDFKIVIELNGKEYKLTVNEARQLYDKLDGIFGKKTNYPQYPYNPPINTPDTTNYPWWKDRVVYCKV